MKSSSIDPRTCPVCGTVLRTCTNITGTRPAPDVGDFTVCAGCTSVLRYGDDMQLRRVGSSDVPMQLRYPIGKARFAAQLARAARN